MGFESAIRGDETIEEARTTVARMRGAADANPSARTAEIPVTAFLSIAALLETLTDRVERSDAVRQARTEAAYPPIDRESLIDTLSAVPTMAGSSLNEVMAPSEIREIADAVMAALPKTLTAPNDVIAFEDNILERILKQYQ